MYKVFIADDEIWVVLGLKKLIEKSGEPFCVIGEANNGVTALEEIEKKKPDVVFTDIRMPGFDGIELLERLTEVETDIKIVLISGYAEFEYAQKAVRFGAFDYLLKPMKLEPIQKVLNRLKKELDKNETKMEESLGESVKLSLISQVLNEINEQYAKDISLTELAACHNISSGYLSKQLKKEVGMSFVEYLTSKRVQKAKELLTDETLSVLAISEMVGYKDYYYFTKVFKKEVGMTPSRYRKSL